MKKSNVLFIAITTTSVVLISAIIADNITSAPQLSVNRAANALTIPPRDTVNISATRQKFNRIGLRLHEGKYWKETNE